MKSNGIECNIIYENIRKYRILRAEEPSDPLLLVFADYHFRNKFIPHLIQFLIALIDCDLAHIAHAIHVLFRDGQITHICHEIDNSRCDAMRRVFRNQVLFFNHNRDELAQLGELVVYIQAATISLDKCFRLRLTEVRFLRIVQVGFQFIDNRHRIFTPLRRAGIVQIEDGRDFFGGARAIVDFTRDINRCANDAITVQASERLVLRYALMDAQRLVDNHL